jgi:ferric-dicitrate binding protein FerR (iron transport regulator)
MQVEVLGTHFNINSYSDEGVIKTTLLEGKVRVTRNGNIALLKPGQQAVVPFDFAQGDPSANSGQAIRIVNDVDVAHVMAWKEGFFEFDNLDLAAIGRQLARWYDVKVEIGQKSGETYGGRISRDLNLSAVVKLLQENGARIRLEDGVVKIG